MATFHTAKSALSSNTLIDSHGKGYFSEDEDTLADSVVDSMHSCAESTLMASASETDVEGDDEEEALMSSHFDYVPFDTTKEDMRRYVSRLQETPTPPLQQGRRQQVNIPYAVR